jgi:hypothetical protein
MATTQLNDTQGTPTNAIKYTLSMWAKRSNTFAGDSNYLASVWVDGNNHWCMRFNDDQLNIYDYISSSVTTELKTNRKFRDPSAWYHIVYVYDSANVTAGDRQKIYVNGVEETSFATDTNPGSSAASVLNVSGRVLTLGARNSASYFEGQMAHVHFADGQAYAPTVFGEVDSTSGIWIPKNSPTVTYGTNGFFLKFASGASGTDSSGNSNDFAVTGNLTSPKDNPENNFCNMNPLDNYYAQYVYSNANQTITNGGSKGFATATMGLSSGLWYWEMKPTAEPGGAYSLIGIADEPTQGTGASNYLGYTATEWGYFGIDGAVRTNQNSPAYGNTWASGDIIGVYLDLNANKLYFSKNGTIQNSGTGVSITAPASLTNGIYYPATGYNDTSASVYNHNFGQGYFGTTAVSTAVADAGGEGQFEYDPSAGTFDGSSKDFRAICTNNLATYG